MIRKNRKRLCVITVCHLDAGELPPKRQNIQRLRRFFFHEFSGLRVCGTGSFRPILGFFRIGVYRVKFKKYPPSGAFGSRSTTCQRPVNIDPSRSTTLPLFFVGLIGCLAETLSFFGIQQRNPQNQRFYVFHSEGYTNTHTHMGILPAQELPFNFKHTHTHTHTPLIPSDFFLTPLLGPRCFSRKACLSLPLSLPVPRPSQISS